MAGKPAVHTVQIEDGWANIIEGAAITSVQTQSRACGTASRMALAEPPLMSIETARIVDVQLAAPVFPRSVRGQAPGGSPMPRATIGGTTRTGLPMTSRS